MWFPNRSDTNRAVQAQKMARDWKFWIQKVENLYYLCSENKGADQLLSYCESAPLFSHNYADCWFSHDLAHMSRKSSFLAKLIYFL